MLYDIGAHVADTLRFVLGDEAVEVTALMGNDVWGSQVDETDALAVRFAGGALATISLCGGSPYARNAVAISGEEGLPTLEPATFSNA